MNCRKCNAQIVNGAKHCPFCTASQSDHSDPGTEAAFKIMMWVFIMVPIGFFLFKPLFSGQPVEKQVQTTSANREKSVSYYTGYRDGKKARADNGDQGYSSGLQISLTVQKTLDPTIDRADYEQGYEKGWYGL